MVTLGWAHVMLTLHQRNAHTRARATSYSCARSHCLLQPHKQPLTFQTCIAELPELLLRQNRL